MSDESPGVVELSIPASAEYIVLCRLALTGLARSRALDPEVLADLKLALTEACSNSIRHAYEDDAGTVEVRYELASDRLSIEVVDAGSGFDPEAVAKDDDELDEGGLGIEIIRALVDELEIESNGGGSSLRFTKFLA
ncbi:MAG TPA: ATP-binding protein [Gaiellaceae bacterium]|nr:ATP-binding protein [Gaiellaceae bacterium]